MNNSFKQQCYAYMMIFLRGMAMGAADIVPGVSGGTIAYITGIYERLLTALSRFRPQAWRVFRTQGASAFWTYIDGGFLLALLAGIGVAMLSVARFLRYGFAHYPSVLFGFFFGLVTASGYVLIQIQRRRGEMCVGAWSWLVLGGVLAFGLTRIPISSAIDAPSISMLFMAGALAICAMVLPGISGSYVLLLLGVYPYALSAIERFDMRGLLPLMLGMLVGILTFVHVVKWLYQRHRRRVSALMAGFVLGSLAKIWPWQHGIESLSGSIGIWLPCVLMAVGVAVVVGIERYARHHDV